ncbi:MAG: hypothetical protein IJS14_13180 [Lentisphaeria bacterium]|nr:hypothetical protein [Lentisphaeria bacterium]
MTKQLVTLLLGSAFAVLAADAPFRAVFNADKGKPDFYGVKLVPGGKSGQAYQIDPGKSCVQVGKFIADPAKTYRLELDLKAAEKPCMNFAVSIRYTNDKRQVTDAKPVAVLPETRTTLAKAAEAGAKTLELQDASKWTRGYPVALGVKEDDSDLPRNTFNSAAGIKGNVVTLAKPLTDALPAGACVVQHRPGYYFRLQAGKVGTEWQHWTVEIPGKRLTPIPGWQYELVLECPKGGNAVLVDDIIIQDASAPAEKIETPAPAPAPAAAAEAKDEALPPFRGRLTARADFDISPVWVAKKFMDKDFRLCLPVARYTPSPDPVARAEAEARMTNAVHFPFETLPPDMRKYMDIPAFREIFFSMGYIDHSAVVKNPDGSLTFDPEVIAKAFPPSDRAFKISAQRFVRPYKPGYKHYFYEAVFRHPNRDKYLEWKAKQKNLMAVASLSEWGNEANILPGRLEKYIKSTKMTPEQEKALRERWPNDLKTRGEYVEKRLKRLFDRHAETWFNDPSALSALEGMWCINHLAAYWGGCNVLIHETSRSLAMWQVQLMFNRGAARQFDKYWGWYAASFLTSFDSKGKWVVDSEPAAWQVSPKCGPGCGVSQNAIERVYRMAWLSGANLFEREDTDRNFWNRKVQGAERWKPAPEGRLFIDFADFVRANPDRGTTYTPVALLVPHDQGACREILPAFGKFPYLKSDNMYHSFIATMFDQFSRQEAQKKGREVTLRNSPYGDIFDILTPDFADATALKKSLPAYKVAILSGGYEKHPAMAEALREYVKNGGTLVLNTVQLNNFDPDFTGVKLTGKTVKDGGYVLDRVELAGAKSLMKLSDGTDVFTSFDFGKGRVIVATPRWLVPDFEDGGTESKTALTRTATGALKFKYTRALLDKIVEEVLPIKVSGEIQYGLNKTKTGWLLYMFNNEGITKFTDTPETFDPKKTARVTVQLKDISALYAFDLCSRESFEIRDGKFTVEVQPGKYRILTLDAPR